MSDSGSRPTGVATDHSGAATCASDTEAVPRQPLQPVDGADSGPANRQSSQSPRVIHVSPHLFVAVSPMGSQPSPPLGPQVSPQLLPQAAPIGPGLRRPPPQLDTGSEGILEAAERIGIMLSPAGSSIGSPAPGADRVPLSPATLPTPRAASQFFDPAMMGTTARTPKGRKDSQRAEWIVQPPIATKHSSPNQSPATRSQGAPTPTGMPATPPVGPVPQYVTKNSGRLVWDDGTVDQMEADGANTFVGYLNQRRRHKEGKVAGTPAVTAAPDPEIMDALTGRAHTAPDDLPSDSMLSDCGLHHLTRAATVRQAPTAIPAGPYDLGMDIPKAISPPDSLSSPRIVGVPMVHLRTAATLLQNKQQHTLQHHQEQQELLHRQQQQQTATLLVQQQKEQQHQIAVIQQTAQVAPGNVAGAAAALTELQAQHAETQQDLLARQQRQQQQLQQIQQEQLQQLQREMLALAEGGPGYLPVASPASVAAQPGDAVASPAFLSPASAPTQLPVRPNPPAPPQAHTSPATPSADEVAARRRLVHVIESYVLDVDVNPHMGSVAVVMAQREATDKAPVEYHTIVEKKYSRSFHSFLRGQSQFRVFHHDPEVIHTKQISHCNEHEGRLAFSDIPTAELAVRDAQTARWRDTRTAELIKEVEVVVRGYGKEGVLVRDLMKQLKQRSDYGKYAAVLPSNHSLRQALKKNGHCFMVAYDRVKVPDMLSPDEHRDWSQRLSAAERRQEEQQEGGGSPTPSQHSQRGPGKRASPPGSEATAPERRRPPTSYVCRRCKIPGHYIQDCPTGATKRLTVDELGSPSAPCTKASNPSVVSISNNSSQESSLASGAPSSYSHTSMPPLLSGGGSQPSVSDRLRRRREPPNVAKVDHVTEQAMSDRLLAHQQARRRRPPERGNETVATAVPSPPPQPAPAHFAPQPPQHPDVQFAQNGPAQIGLQPAQPVAYSQMVVSPPVVVHQGQEMIGGMVGVDPAMDPVAQLRHHHQMQQQLLLERQRRQQQDLLWSGQVSPQMQQHPPPVQDVQLIPVQNVPKM